MENAEWRQMEQRLRGMCEELEDSDRQFGNSETHERVAALKRDVEEALKAQSVQAGWSIYDQMWQLDFMLLKPTALHTSTQSRRTILPPYMKDK